MPDTKKTTRCLFCSLMCPVAVKESAAGVVQMDYVNSSDNFYQGRICYRGNYLAALLNHPRRLTTARKQPADATNGDIYKDVLLQAAGTINQAGANDSLGVLISGNLPVEQIIATARFFQDSVSAKHVGLFVPPGDQAISDGLAATKPDLAEFDDLDNAQSILAIGDVLGTHPVLAHKIMAFREKSSKHDLINIGSITGRTMRFASQSLRVNVNTESLAVLALAQLANAEITGVIKKAPTLENLLNQCGSVRSDLERIVNSMKKAENSLILLTIPPGATGQAKLLAAAAGSLAKATKSKLLPLYSWAGSPGSLTLSSYLGLSDTAQWLAAAQQGEFSTILIADVDLAAMVPDDLWSTIRSQTESLIVASAMPTLTAQSADFSLPMAFNFEMDGHVYDHRHNPIKLSALGKPPGIAATPADLIARMSAVFDRKPELPDDAVLEKIKSSTTKATGSIEVKLPIDNSLNNLTDSQFALISRTENLDLYQGGISRQLDWLLTLEPTPVVLINPEDAVLRHIDDQKSVSLVNNNKTGRFSARINAAVPPGVVAVSPGINETRDFYRWHLNGNSIEIESVPVELKLLS
ncbi:MAG: hypothetical protein JXD22_05845 [Sedimentisphaerales bacterium]|nr:hypothetical protein [Sedimentisphaerales bacterium]